MGSDPLFTTARLSVRTACAEDRDVDFYYALWTDPDVMRFVGFPRGLRTSRDEILRRIAAQGDSPLDALLVVERTEDGQIIGECKLGSPDAEGIAHTDVKLLPRFWGRGFGTELKHALVRYLFVHTDCRAVQATPNRDNIASQKMQEAVGARRISEGIHRFPEHMRAYTTDVPFYVYRIRREEWEKASGGSMRTMPLG